MSKKLLLKCYLYIYYVKHRLNQCNFAISNCSCSDEFSNCIVRVARFTDSSRFSLLMLLRSNPYNRNDNIQLYREILNSQNGKFIRKTWFEFSFSFFSFIEYERDSAVMQFIVFVHYIITINTFII